jgi:hypothetical protein
MNTLLVDLGDRLAPCCPKCKAVVDLRGLSRDESAAGRGAVDRSKLLVPVLAVVAAAFIMFMWAVSP